MRRVWIVVALMLAVSGCGRSNSVPSPTSPSVVRAAYPTFTVSGVVTAEGGARVEGAEVRVAGTHGTSDGSGNYELSGVPASYGGVSAVKAGYAAAREVLTVSGDTRFDFQLGPRVAIYTLSGVVLEETPTGLVPVEDAVVHEWSCEDAPPLPPFFPKSCPVSIYQTTSTDKRGVYSFSGLYSGRENNIGVNKDGFDDPRVDPNGPEGNGQEVTINGDTWLELRLVRR